MRQLVPALLCLGLLTGCGSEPSENAATSESVASPASATSTPAPTPSTDVPTIAPTATEDETCDALLSENLDGPLLALDDLMQPLLNVEVIDEEWPDEAHQTAREINEIAEDAGLQLKGTIEDAVAPLNTILESRRFDEVDPADFTRPAAELMDFCRKLWGDVPLISPGGSESGEIVITGDVLADLKAAGITVDDPEGRVERMGLLLCHENVDPTDTQFKTLVDTFADPSPDLVRIAIAYGCPDRAEAAEELL